MSSQVPRCSPTSFRPVPTDELEACPVTEVFGRVGDAGACCW